MRLLTLNCHAWQEENQIEKIQHLAAVIKEKQYDVIALQEVMQLIDRETDEKIKVDNYAVVLLNELLKLGVSDYRFVWDMAHIGFDVYEEALAILTKCEIKNSQSFLVTQSQEIGNFRTRRIVGLEMVYNQKPVAVYSCHLGWFHDEIEPFTGQIDGWEKNQADLRIDLVLTTQPVEVISSHVIFNGENKKVVSDHYGVEVEIRL